MRIDLHIHTNFSSDSEETLERILKQAKERKIDVIGITDHIDYDYQDPSISFLLDLDAYSEKLTRLREQAEGIEILYGVEAGLQPHIADQLTALVDRYDFDYVMGSMHTIERKDLYIGTYFEGKTPMEAWEGYFRDVIDSVRAFDRFQFFGHFDILKRYDEKTRAVPYARIRPMVREALSVLIDHQVGLEINTSGLRGTYGLAETLPGEQVLRDYKDLGGEIITIGSDAHRAEDVGAGFDHAIGLLKDVGFERIYYAKKRQLIPITLDT